MSEKTYAVSLYVRVRDKKELFKTASAQAKKDGMSDAEIKEMLKDSDNKIDVSACLRMIFDPGTSPAGCEILDSSCE